MPLSILVPLVVVGLAIGLTAIHFLGGTVVAKIESIAEAKIRFNTDFPNAIIGECFLSADQKTVLLFDENGRPLGLVLALGSKQITRHFGQSKSWAANSGENEILFKMADLTLPNVSYLTNDAAELAKLAPMLTEIDPELDKS